MLWLVSDNVLREVIHQGRIAREQLCQDVFLVEQYIAYVQFVFTAHVPLKQAEAHCYQLSQYNLKLRMKNLCIGASR